MNVIPQSDLDWATLRTCLGRANRLASVYHELVGTNAVRGARPITIP